MTGDRFAREKEIFLEAQERAGEDRARYLGEACGDDADLRAEVEALLEADERMSSAFDAPDVQVEGFRIIRQIGAGGMGVVFEAEQLQPPRRVALKVLRFGLVSEELKARFRYESETLGRLDHPGIARIYAAGVAGDRPWFAMELVDGAPLHEYADAHGLGARKRLELVIAICEAVQHAHRRGIVHRDLKPTNILVDARGRPRLLDFGIAKSEEQQASLATRAGELLGTVPYMSPEQVSGDPAAVDVRADVYALGVVLHELLTGRRPLDLEGKPLVEALLAVRSQEPASLGTVDTRWRGDVETIVAKALEKDPARRYENAGALGADLARHLADQPILARPATTGYQLRKFVRRNRALVGGVVATMLVLVGGVVSASIYAVDADRQRGRFEEERNEARRQQERADAMRAEAVLKARTVDEVLRFVLDIFYTGDPQHTRNELPLPQLLEAAEKRAFGLDMEASALVHVTHTLGFIQLNRGDYESALRLFERTVELARGLSDPARLSHDLMHLGRAHAALVHPAEARKAFDEALSLVGDGESRPRALLLIDRGNLVLSEGRLEEAVADFRSALAAEPTGATASKAYLGLATAATRAEKADEALEHLDAARREALAAEGADALAMRPILSARASLLARSGRHEEALSTLTELIVLESERVGPLHRSVFTLRNNYATSLMRAGRHADAAKWQAEVVADAETVYPPDAPDLLHMLWVLTTARTNIGETDGLEPLARRVVEGHKKRFGVGHPSTQGSMQTLARILARAGQSGPAAELFEEAARGGAGVPALRAWTVSGYSSAASHYVAAGRLDDAARAAAALAKVDGGPSGYRVLADVLLKQQDLDGAQRAALAALRAATGANEPTYEERLLLARIALAGGHRDRARKLAEGAVEEAVRAVGEDHDATKAARAFLAELENP